MASRRGGGRQLPCRGQPGRLGGARTGSAPSGPTTATIEGSRGSRCATRSRHPRPRSPDHRCGSPLSVLGARGGRPTGRARVRDRCRRRRPSVAGRRIVVARRRRDPDRDRRSPEAHLRSTCALNDMTRPIGEAAARRNVELLVLPTSDAFDELRRTRAETNAILCVAC